MFIVACTLSGCAGFYRDEVKYQNRTVIKVGDYAITQFDLDSAYRNANYDQYVRIGYMTEADAREQVKTSLVDGYILYQQIKDNITLTPTVYQLNEIAKNVVDSAISQMADYLSQARKIYKVDAPQEDSETEDSSTKYSRNNYQKYSHRATLKKVGEEYVIEYNLDKFPTPTLDEAVIDQTILNNLNSNISSATYLQQYVSAIKEKFLQQLYNSVKDEQLVLGESKINVGEQLADKALSLLVDDLINYEYYLRQQNPKQYNLSTDDLLYRFFKRNVDGQIQNQFITNLRNDYLSTHTNELKPTELLAEWKNTIEFNKQYNTDQEGYKSKMRGISTDGDSVLYHPVLDDCTQFGYFIHALLTSEEFTKEVERINEEYPETDSEHKSARETALNSALSLIKIQARDVDGNLAETKTDLSTIIDEYNSIVAKSNMDVRISEFINFMFKYSSDPGLLSGGMPYVVGTNGNSNMNEPFTLEAVNLMTGKTGNKLNTPNQFDGNMSIFTRASKYADLCIANNSDGSYGIHLILFVGDVKNYDVDSSVLTLADLNKTINPLTKETYFDMLFDKVYPATSDTVLYSSKNGYSEYESNIISGSELKKQVVYYK